ncbi:MAG: molybdate ABC transporter substrate-binding protein [Candidatus Brocadiae bacterium]|nr:molybdate ABC transporter substrate-binding protein [Candidatus Brocadiia bacterium]
MPKQSTLILIVVLLVSGILLTIPLLPKKFKTEILVSAAISLKDAITQIGNDFEKKHPEIQVYFNFASSGQLRIQIENGAPVDIFISASPMEMELLEKKGCILASSKVDLVKNRLVFIKNKNLQFKITKLEELIKFYDLKIAIGNPATVPAGRYAQQALKFYQIWEKIENRLILGENVRQVLDYVARGEVDAGFVYVTDTIKESQIEILLSIPEEAHKTIVYPMAIIKTSRFMSVAQDFVLFAADEKKFVWQQFGFQCD